MEKREPTLEELGLDTPMPKSPFGKAFDSFEYPRDDMPKTWLDEVATPKNECGTGDVTAQSSSVASPQVGYLSIGLLLIPVLLVVGLLGRVAFTPDYDEPRLVQKNSALPIQLVISGLQASDYVALLSRMDLDIDMSEGPLLKSWLAKFESISLATREKEEIQIHLFENVYPPNTVSHLTIEWFGRDAQSAIEKVAFFGASACDSFEDSEKWIRENFQDRHRKPEAVFGNCHYILAGDSIQATLFVKNAK